VSTPIEQEAGMNMGTTDRARLLASAVVGVLTLHGQAIAQSARFDELANLPVSTI
jgi:hypothetical protein